MAMQRLDTNHTVQPRPGDCYPQNIGQKGIGQKNGAAMNTSAVDPASVGANPGDHAVISSNARVLVDLRAAVDTGREVIASTPDVRHERLAQVRERLAAGYYQSAEVRQRVAGRVLKVIDALDSL